MNKNYYNCDEPHNFLRRSQMDVDDPLFKVNDFFNKVVDTGWMEPSMRLRVVDAKPTLSFPGKIKLTVKWAIIDFRVWLAKKIYPHTDVVLSRQLGRYR